jgi:hypothetical protein
MILDVNPSTCLIPALRASIAGSFSIYVFANATNSLSERGRSATSPARAFPVAKLKSATAAMKRFPVASCVHVLKECRELPPASAQSTAEAPEDGVV